MKGLLKQAVFSGMKCHNSPSLYAPPVAWAVAQFIQSLVEGHGGIAPEETGLVVASDECSLETIREISRTAAEGSVSPRRFVGASPSVVAGLPALQQGIRGPTLCLTMPPEHAFEAIAALIRYWTRYNKVSEVIAVAHWRLGDSHHMLKGLVASPGESIAPKILQLCDPLAQRATP